MSFRPLFAEQDRLHEATTEFEKVLGQPSGAYIGVVLESDSILTPAFLSALSSVSDNVASLNHSLQLKGILKRIANWFFTQNVLSRSCRESASVQMR